MTIEKCPEPVNFEELFRREGTKEHPYPREINYNSNKVFLLDEFPVKKGEKLLFTIESTNSRYRQGFQIKIYNGHLIVDGEPMEYKKRCAVFFWEEFKESEVQVFTKKGRVFISNIWEETIYEEHKSGYFGDIDGSYTNNKIFRYPKGKTVVCSQDSGRWNQGLCNGAAMYAEDLPDGKRYFCNDGDEDDDFDDIIFTVRRVP